LAAQRDAQGLGEGQHGVQIEDGQQGTLGAARRVWLHVKHRRQASARAPQMDDVTVQHGSKPARASKTSQDLFFQKKKKNRRKKERRKTYS
jgi:hypothetical protein